MQTGGDSFQMHKNKLVWGIVVGVIVAIIIVVAALLFLKKDKVRDEGSNTDDSVYTQLPPESSSDSEERDDSNTSSEVVTWQWNGSSWQPSSTPPECDEPIELTMPVDIDTVSSVLYPGQLRNGTQYKPHGGFRFNVGNEDVEVRAPMDAYLVHGSTYIEQGNVQYLLFFVNPCGIAYRFDHILTPSDEMKKYTDQLPAPKVDDSRTTNFNEPIFVKKGTLIATGVGFLTTKNASLDLGVYDLREQNEASKDPAYAAKHADEASQTSHAVCWFDMFPASDAAILKDLPAADPASGKTSDYCK